MFMLRRSDLRAALLFAGMLLLSFQAKAAQITFPIQADTYLDSRNPSTNVGAAGTVKALINSSDGSVCRGLLQLPPEVGLYSADQIVEASVYLYLWQDNTADRNVTLYPLTRSFVEGTGLGDGATWITYDGTNAWTLAGGDFDTNHPVVAVKEPILDPDLHDRFFRWDITALLTNDPARSELLNCGAMLLIDEVPPPSSGTPRAPFTSSDDMAYGEEFRPRVRLLVIPRTVDVHYAVAAGNALTLVLTNCTPFVTHRVERTFDLRQADGWTFVTNLVPAGGGTNWVEPTPPEGSNAFYRIAGDP